MVKYRNSNSTAQANGVSMAVRQLFCVLSLKDLLSAQIPLLLAQIWLSLIHWLSWYLSLHRQRCSTWSCIYIYIYIICVSYIQSHAHSTMEICVVCWRVHTFMLINLLKTSINIEICTCIVYGCRMIGHISFKMLQHWQRFDHAFCHMNACKYEI